MARDIGEQMILAEWLFVETIDDLHRRTDDPASRTRYELLGIAPLLRKLLLDGATCPFPCVEGVSDPSQLPRMEPQGRTCT